MLSVTGLWMAASSDAAADSLIFDKEALAKDIFEMMIKKMAIDLERPLEHIVEEASGIYLKLPEDNQRNNR